MEVGIGNGPGHMVLLRLTEHVASHVDPRAAQVVQQYHDLAKCRHCIHEHPLVVIVVLRLHHSHKQLKWVVE